jgi:hypothetical protein
VAAAEVEEVEAEAGQVGNRDIKEVTFETNTDFFACIMFLVYYLYLVCCNTSHSFRASHTQKAIERETREIGRQGERSIYSIFDFDHVCTNGESNLVKEGRRYYVRRRFDSRRYRRMK